LHIAPPRAGVATVAAGVLAAGAFTLVSSAGASPSGAASAVTASMRAGHASYGFRTLDDNADLTFNQLLGINDEGLIAGYFGSGAQGHPNMGICWRRAVTEARTSPAPCRPRSPG